MHATVFVLALSCMTAGIHQAGDQSLETREKAELTRLEAAWNEAHRRGDAETLDRLWADDLVVTVQSMPVMGKADAIGIWRTGRMTFDRYETSDVGIRVYGEAAVVTGRLDRSRRVKDRVVEDAMRFTKVYVRRGGRWQVVAWHGSAAAE